MREKKDTEKDSSSKAEASEEPALTRPITLSYSSTIPRIENVLMTERARCGGGCGGAVAVGSGGVTSGTKGGGGMTAGTMGGGGGGGGPTP